MPLARSTHALSALLAAGLMLSVAGCGDPGPSEAELAAAKVEKDCGKLYSSLTKVYQDQLYKAGVADVDFMAKDKFVKVEVWALHPLLP